MRALRANEDMSIYSRKSIQIIVNNHWSKWYPFYFLLILLPMLLQLLLFTAYSVFLMPRKPLVTQETFDLIKTLS